MKPEFLVRAFVVSQDLSWQPLHKGHASLHLSPWTRLVFRGPPPVQVEIGVVPSLRTTLFLSSRAYILLCPEVLLARLPIMFLRAAAAEVRSPAPPSPTQGLAEDSIYLGVWGFLGAGFGIALSGEAKPPLCNCS